VLTLWIPDFLNPYTQNSDALVLIDQIEAFTGENRDITVQVRVKKAHGEGGLYNLLSTAFPVAPAVLPDLIMVDEEDLLTGVREGYLVPLAYEIDDPLPYPFTTGTTASETGGSHGVPYLAQIEQTVYSPGVYSAPPLSWTTVLTGNYSLLLPGASESSLASDALVTAYLGVGGQVVDEGGRPMLDRVRLEELYRFLVSLREAGLLDSTLVLELEDAQACWTAYRAGFGNLSVVPAGAYWTVDDPTGRPGWIPTPDGEPVALARTWYLALVDSENSDREAALALARWLASPDRVAELSYEVGMLPAHSEALNQWPLTQEELEFLDLLMRSAASPLPADVDQPVRRALQAGLQLLLENDAVTPEEAASRALTMLRN
jgi:hypothetical protein